MRPQHCILCGLIAVLSGLAGLTSAGEKKPADPPKQPTDQAGEEKSPDLLAGGDLRKHFETTGNWTLTKEGVAHLQPRPGEAGWKRFDAYLWLKESYKDFECEFEYKHDKRGNSGFYFNVGDRKNPVRTGIEVQLIDSAGKKGKLSAHGCSGGILPNSVAPEANAAKPAGEWNHVRVTSVDGAVTVTVNGVLVSQGALNHPKLASKPKQGAISFQDHGLPFWLRKIRVRRLQSVAAEKVSFQIKLKKEGDRIDIAQAGDESSAGPVLAVHSPSGIGGATFERKSKDWPKGIKVRLYLKGLESFRVTSGKTALEASVLSHGEHRQLLRLRKGGRERPLLAKKGPYWTTIEAFNAQGKPIKGLPKEGGYFEMALPEALFSDNPPSIQLDWIDFHRG